jgi:hypothetical protein
MTEFHGSSFFSGMFMGVILSWSNILPMMCGVFLGMSITKLPEIVNFESLPTIFKNYLKIFVGDQNEEKIKEMFDNVTQKKKKKNDQ